MPTENAKIAVVTGGSGSIGLACGAELVRRGFDVVLTARREDKLAAAAAEIGARHVAADSADEESFADVVAAVDHVDLLVLSAGILDGTFVRKEEPATFDEVQRANLRSAFVATWATLPKMPAGGRIIFVSSTAAADPMKGFTAYSASKAGVDAFAKSLAREVARDGIQVHIVSPGPVLTPMLRTPRFPMHVIRSEDVAQLVGFLTTLRPEVVMPEIRFWGAEEGPFEAETVSPENRPPGR
ncbi:MAG TPA: SDR family oxidoreductase [Acidimicrobiales bacterium]|nr:SDR family oxidoreductase [Acidimicrobiales bacterium]